MIRPRAAAGCVVTALLAAACATGDGAAVPSATSIEMTTTEPAVDSGASDDAGAPDAADEPSEPGTSLAPSAPEGDSMIRVAADAVAREGVRRAVEEIATLGVRLELVEVGAGDIDIAIAAGPDAELFVADVQAAGAPLVIAESEPDDAWADAARVEVTISAALLFDAVAARVALGEYQTIVVVGADDPVRASAIESLEARGAVVVMIDVDPSNPASVEAASSQVGDVGDGAAVVVAASADATELVEAVIERSPDSSIFASSVAIDGSAAFSGAQLVLVGPALPPDSTEAADADTGAELFVRDATLLAVAAEIASDDVDPVAALVAASRDGTPCASAAECIELIRDGVDVDVDGASGPLDLDDGGALRSAWFEIESFAPAGVDVILHRRGG